MKNIKYVKDHANLEKVLKYLKIDYTHNGDSYRSACPIHGGTSKTSFDINSETGMWYCHSKCKIGGDIIELVQKLKGISFLQACDLIADISGFTIDGIEFTKEEISHYEDAKEWIESLTEEIEFKEYNLDVQEIFKVNEYRGLSKELLEEYEIFYAKEFILSNGTTHNRIGFPIYFLNKLIGVQLRATRRNAIPKWISQPKGLSVGNALYNYDKICTQDIEFLIIVEGIMDCLALIEEGYPCVCTFGSKVTDKQKEFLENLGVDIYIAYDGDTAGRKGALKSFEKLQYTCDVYFIDIPDGHDPYTIDKELFRELFENAKKMR